MIFDELPLVSSSYAGPHAQGPDKKRKKAEKKKKKKKNGKKERKRVLHLFPGRTLS